MGCVTSRHSATTKSDIETHADDIKYVRDTRRLIDSYLDTIRHDQEWAAKHGKFCNEIKLSWWIDEMKNAESALLVDKEYLDTYERYTSVYTAEGRTFGRLRIITPPMRPIGLMY